MVEDIYLPRKKNEIKDIPKTINTLFMFKVR